jgi:peptidoglycan-N-acetylglucosamine deacetylase
MRRFSRFLILIAVGVALIIAAWQVSKAKTFQFFGDIIARVPGDEKVVALTFDDGPTQPALDALLPVLRDRGVKATFFLIGNELERRPDLGRRLVAAGHELGNHTHAHKRMLFKSPGFVEQELQRTDALIRSAGHSGDIHFRPPYGAKFLVLPYVLKQQDRKTVMWDIDPDSHAEVAATSSGIVEYVVSRVQPGSIILLHVMYPTRATSRQAVPALIDELQSRGYRFVTVTELLRSQPASRGRQ